MFIHALGISALELVNFLLEHQEDPIGDDVSMEGKTLLAQSIWASIFGSIQPLVAYFLETDPVIMFYFCYL